MKNWRAPLLKNAIAELTEVIREKPRLYEKMLIALDTVSEEMEISFHADFFYVLDAPSSVDAKIRFNEQSADQISVKKGYRFQLPVYRIFLTNSAQAGVVLTVLLGKDLAFDFAELGVVNVDAIQQPIKSQAANNWDVAGSPVAVDSTAGGTIIKAANAARQSITVKIKSVTAGSVAFGKNGVTYPGGAGAAGSITLEVGQSYTFNHTGEIRAITNAAQTAAVEFEEEYNT